MLLSRRNQRGLLTSTGLVVLGLVLGVSLSLWPSASAQQPPPFRARSYYLTQTEHDGANAPTACVAGFHMASLWEIFDTSNLAYDTTLGVTQADSGSGPPSIPARGWIRTGYIAAGGTIGSVNCNAYSSSAASDQGTAVGLIAPRDAEDPADAWGPWNPEDPSCSSAQPVWCVEDRF